MPQQIPHFQKDAAAKTRPPANPAATTTCRIPTRGWEGYLSPVPCTLYPGASPSSPASRSRNARVPAETGTIGSRYRSSSLPIIARIAFTGPGLVSLKIPCISRKYFRLIRLAADQSFPRAARTISAISAGIRFDTTETSPAPPTPSTPSVIPSSPE